MDTYKQVDAHGKQQGYQPKIANSYSRGASAPREYNTNDASGRLNVAGTPPLLVFSLFVITFTIEFSWTLTAQPVNRTPVVSSAASPLSDLSLVSFDHLTRIEVGKTEKPWLNILGNGLFGGHRILLLANRGDGQEFRVDTSQSATLDTDLHWSNEGTLQNTIHGIGYSTFTFMHEKGRSVEITYFLEPDADDSEVWIVKNSAGRNITLNCGKRSIAFQHDMALRVTDGGIEQIPVAAARNALSAARQKWYDYLKTAMEKIGIRGEIKPVMLREFVWDIYQVVAMVSVDQYTSSGDKPLTLRNANMGGTYTILGLDVHGRDTLQMIPAISRFDPSLAREILLNMARYTDRTGRICHRRLLAGQPIDRGHSDESYWFVIALIDYLNVTHDLTVLDERVPYLENDLKSEYVLFKDPAWVQQFEAKAIPPAKFTAGSTTMLEHAHRAIAHVDLGSHNLPLMEDGDWNDALNGMRQKGESVMNAGLYGFCLQQLTDLWQELGKDKVDELLGSGSFDRDLNDFSVRYRSLKTAVNQNAWNGDWYVRGFDNQGMPFGSHLDAEGSIYLNAQSWLILAGIPDEERIGTMISSVNRFLRKENKLSLLAPVYRKPDTNLGNITRLPPGGNENGGQWRQCTLWWIAALRKSKGNRDAQVLFDPLLLANEDLRRMGTEAHLYNEYLRGPEAADPGSAGQQAHV